MSKFICIHGHFYQPPRENPWLEIIEVEDSARPFHDWNDRITMECYGPNTASRITVGNPPLIKNIVSNYSRISFNFGPTLLSWMEKERPRIYAAVLDADRISRKTHSGHGNAIAQVYNHVIMPLTNRRNKTTQVLWGIADFERRFGRRPEGLWLPETAVDLETLEVLAEQGIRFTLLAPHQARRIRPLSGGDWRDVSHAKIDPSRPYLIRLPSGQNMTLFFYDGPISRAVAFEGLLGNGSHLVGRLMGAFNNNRPTHQLIHIATDGESYGHHHPHGDMALSYAIDQIERMPDVRLTNYAEFLEGSPPIEEVEIFENTSWSCAHGVERWKSNCGCRLSAGSSQEWRKPLREAIQWLEEEINPIFEREGAGLFKDPWEARNGYIDVMGDRSEESKEVFLNRYAQRTLNAAERQKAFILLEMERHVLLMQTSCAWFFDEVSGIETMQALKYAARAIQLAAYFGADSLEEAFIARLRQAPSNLHEIGNGGAAYERYVRSSLIGLDRVVAHYAISSLFEPIPAGETLYSYDLTSEEYAAEEFGGTRLAIGRVRIQSQITEGSQVSEFCSLYVGGQDFHCSIRPCTTAGKYAEMRDHLFRQFSSHTVTDLIRAIDQAFGNRYFSVQDLFLEARRRILGQLMRENTETLEGDYLNLYEKNQKLMVYLSEIQVPAPESFRVAAQFVLNRNLQKEINRLQNENPDATAIEAIVREARRWSVSLETHAIVQTLRRHLEMALGNIAIDPKPEYFHRFEVILTLAKTLDAHVDLWGVQNQYFQLRKQLLPVWQQDGEIGDMSSSELIVAFNRLGEQLGFQIP